MMAKVVLYAQTLFFMTKFKKFVSILSKNNIKMIKLYSWIKIFKEMIDKKRKEELSFQFIRMCYIMLTLGSLVFFPMFLQIVSFEAYIGSSKDHEMDLATAYTIITIFNLI